IKGNEQRKADFERHQNYCGVAREAGPVTAVAAVTAATLLGMAMPFSLLTAGFVCFSDRGWLGKA
ncbi:MAG: hypothetical protein WB950_15630, partial [Acidobacteriaceae bacterium]